LPWFASSIRKTSANLQVLIMDENQFVVIRTTLTNEEMLKELTVKADKAEAERLAKLPKAPTVVKSIDIELLQKLQESAYTEEELQQVITLVWSLDDKHPTLWTGVARKLIITMMRDRLAGTK
jgi:hypothetical protein